MANGSDWGTTMKEKGVLGTSIHLSHRQGRGAYAELRGSNCRPTTETPPARSTGSRPPPRASAETGKVLEIHGHVDNEGGTPLSVGDKGHGCVFAVSSSRACGAQRNKRRTHSSLEVSSPSAGAPWANRSPPPPGQVVSHTCRQHEPSEDTGKPV